MIRAKHVLATLAVVAGVAIFPAAANAVTLHKVGSIKFPLAGKATVTKQHIFKSTRYWGFQISGPAKSRLSVAVKTKCSNTTTFTKTYIMYPPTVARYYDYTVGGVVVRKPTCWLTLGITNTQKAAGTFTLTILSLK